MTNQETIERAAEQKAWDHEDAIADDRFINATALAKSNYYHALDQQHEYESLEEALVSAEINVSDTGEEMGWSHGEICDALCAFNELKKAAS